MNERTICGFSLAGFKFEPTPEELASIIARMPSDKQAEFFCLLAEQIKNCCGLSEHMQVAYIAQGIVEFEDTFCDGGGSRLISQLAEHITEYQNSPEEIR